ncbi:hypothetical protein K435DRAFT_964400 [Dendrothele bispora CBS 962.96]|uniref:Uncharacterized protein n=1 Tax=Dendrothele bispora (strain CBS 962.96) TaxID=1314807 RepID=A0A4S8MAX9_DENBC|nr:hypothetical protein K435DRAFT_964400 [Dendrothele bispora CBS 962.96]
MQPFGPQNSPSFPSNNVPQIPQMPQVQGSSMVGPFNMGNINMPMNLNFMGGMGMNNVNAMGAVNNMGRSFHSSNDGMSIELFKANIQVTLEKVLSVQSIARATLAGIQNAYHAGSNPAQTEANIATLKQDLSALADLMRHSGVGALPLLLPQLPPLPTDADQSSTNQTPSIVVPSEEQMLADATKSVNMLFEQLNRMRDSAGTVANLLQVAPIGQSGVISGSSNMSIG